jgi:hypothetical protein
MSETAAAFPDLLKWIFQSWWRAAIAGLIVGAGATGCATLVILAFDMAAPDLTYLIALVAYMPADFFLSIGVRDAEHYQGLLTRFGRALFIVLNGILAAILFPALVMISKLFSQNQSD